MRLNRHLYFIGVVVCIVYMAAVPISAQQANSFSGNFIQTTYVELFKAIEHSTDYRFYFDPSQFDSIKFDFQTDEKSIPQVLDLLFVNTDYYYAIDYFNNIYIVRGIYLQSQLPDDYFNLTADRDSVHVKMQGAIRNELQVAIQSKLNIIGRVTNDFTPGEATITGVIVDTENRNPVVGATVFCVELGIGAVSDPSGRYKITLPKGVRTIQVSSVGFKNSEYKIAVYGDGNFDIILSEDISLLNEVIVESERGMNVKGMQMGFEKLDMKVMKKFSAVMGEVDILKVIQALPGVQTVGEASNGLNVRGGSADQNLILYNNAVVYNPTHLFGFFTAFNPDEIKSAELMKSGIPADLGGRLSSVIEINSRSGNDEKFVGTGGIGPLTGKLTLEGPLIKNKTSLLMGVRSSYSDWLLSKVPNDAISNSSASFYDVNLNVDHKHNRDNSIFYSAYWSNDKFKFNEDSLYRYNNLLTSLSWKHSFNDRLNGLFVLSHSGYNYSVESEANVLSAFRLSYGIRQTDIKGEFSLVSTGGHGLLFGFNSTLYAIQPGMNEPLGDSSLISTDRLQSERAIENVVFIGDSFDLNPRLSVYGGLRYSIFTALGPKNVYQYAGNLPKKEDTIVDTLAIRSGAVATHHGPEYRASLKYQVREDFSIKASYNLMRQYIHMLSNATSISPTDIWKISDTHIQPQRGSQWSIGVYKNFRSGSIATSLEGYYKQSRNILDYKDGADLILNHNIETDVVNASGIAFGAELMIKKLTGRLNGWISYTYSRSYLRTSSEFATETVNNGNYYPSNYDKPHSANFVGNFKFSHRLSLSMNTTYSTGRPITLPLAKYQLDDAIRLFYSERNQHRVPDYFRIDLSVNLEGNHKIRKLAHSSWTFGIYNLTGRNNVYSVYFRSEGNSISGYKMSIFGSPIPSITYNFRF